MNSLAKILSVWFLSGLLVVLIGLYAAYLHLRVAQLEREMQALQQQNEALQSVLAEHDEQKALQKKLEAQLRQLSDLQQTKQQEELSRLRQQVQQIPALKAQNDQLKERLRELVSTTPGGLRRGSDVLSGAAGSPTETDTAWAGFSAPAPAGTSVTNVALGKKVTTSAPKTSDLSLTRITDGIRDPNQLVALPRGVQWVQIDLEQEFSLYAVRIWHDILRPRKCRDVIVQAADNPDFKENVTTLFNNDADNSSNLGTGNDKEYIETSEGKTISAQNVRARYLRFYSAGSDLGIVNTYVEIEAYAYVWGNPVATELPSK